MLSNGGPILYSAISSAWSGTSTAAPSGWEGVPGHPWAYGVKPMVNHVLGFLGSVASASRCLFTSFYNLNLVLENLLQNLSLPTPSSWEGWNHQPVTRIGSGELRSCFASKHIWNWTHISMLKLSNKISQNPLWEILSPTRLVSTPSSGLFAAVKSLRISDITVGWLMSDISRTSQEPGCWLSRHKAFPNGWFTIVLTTW